MTDQHQQQQEQHQRGQNHEHNRLDLHIDRIPHQLREHDQFLLARRSPQSDRDKVPLHPPRTDAPDSRLSFEDAIAGWQSPASVGIATDLRPDEYPIIGFVFTSTDEFVLIDWDDVHDPETGTIPPIVADDIRQLGGYIELSPSKTGIHQIGTIDATTAAEVTEADCKGPIPSETIGSLPDRPHVEIYYAGQYGTLTGWSVPPLSTTLGASGSESNSDSDITAHASSSSNFESESRSKSDFSCQLHTPCDMSASLVDTIGTYLQTDARLTSSSPTPTTADQETDSSTSTSASTSTSITELSSRAARQSQRDTTASKYKWIETENPTPTQIWATGQIHGDDDFCPLWMGEDLHHLSRSEADCAFISKLWFFCDDRELVDRCFRVSKRMRSKWNRDSYRETTIKYASDNPDRYTGAYPDVSGDDLLP